MDEPAVEGSGGQLGEVLWAPTDEYVAGTGVGAFLRWIAESEGRRFGDYDELWRWSTTDLAGFWDAIWRYYRIRARTPFTEVLDGAPMPETRWFTGATLNYAEQCLTWPPDRPALRGWTPDGRIWALSFGELAREVARARSGLAQLGVARGDVVVAYLPNCAQTVVTLLAAASLGATFASCAPEFGLPSVVQRFAPLGPKVLVATDGYWFRGKAVDRTADVRRLRDALPSVTHVVGVPVVADGGRASTDLLWADLRRDEGPLEFEAVPADHPLYVLFSSGTTGAPKAIVHGHGRVLVEHLKVLNLHLDIGAGDVLLQPSTTSWMVWNLAVSALALGATMVCFDGDPAWPTTTTLWQLAADCEATAVGCGAAFLVRCMKEGVRPADACDLRRLRSVASTGSPLPAEGYRWVYEALGDVFFASGSGGTDVCSGFVGGVPLLPVTAGEMACRYLGVAADSFDANGRPLRGRPGELVITEPMPSMPVRFVGDDDGSMYRTAYFDTFPDVWRHGDWITITDRGTCVITGRSDATLNRAGVRIGTAELYAVVDGFPDVVDSVVVHLEDPAGGPGELVLLVVLADAAPTDVVDRLRDAIRQSLSPRHVPDSVHLLEGLPRTLTGKKLEVPIKRILQGAELGDVLSPAAVSNPESLDQLENLRDERLRRSATGRPQRR